MFVSRYFGFVSDSFLSKAFGLFCCLEVVWPFDLSYLDVPPWKGCGHAFMASKLLALLESRSFDELRCLHFLHLFHLYKTCWAMQPPSYSATCQGISLQPTRWWVSSPSPVAPLCGTLYPDEWPLHRSSLGCTSIFKQIDPPERNFQVFLLLFGARANGILVVVSTEAAATNGVSSQSSLWPSMPTVEMHGEAWEAYGVFAGYLLFI